MTDPRTPAEALRWAADDILDDSVLHEMDAGGWRKWFMDDAAIDAGIRAKECRRIVARLIAEAARLDALDAVPSDALSLERRTTT